MQISPQLRMDIEKVVVITIFYMIISLFMAFNNNVMIASEFSLGFSGEVTPEFNLYVHVLIGLLAGMIGGSLFVFVNARLFRKKSFRFGLVSTLITYTSVFILITAFVSVFAADDLNYFDPGAIIQEIWSSITAPMALVNFLFWGFISLCTLFMLQVNDKFGPGILRKFLLGKYTQPTQEERVFMFLDMKSSTSIAENMSPNLYFRLLRDCFSDVAQPVIMHEGEIYQYVGDEIVVSWESEKGFRNGNCLKCFHALQRKIEKRKDYYLNKYGVLPVFKAGLHYGTVTAGEIGDIKKDIVYSGDVLNTTARIQNLCNQYQADLLASEEALSQIQWEDLGFSTTSLGSISLRGRKQEVLLSSVSNFGN
ncbi:MAG: adenylate/guanylate cyclase domain-containing protein [Bacteroidia bacterium]|nr:adenylate/guanylate cyclase domain-containing protein [Bacteroidia bacterium]